MKVIYLDYFEIVENIANNILQLYDYNDPEMLKYDIEENLENEINKAVRDKRDAFDIMISSDTQSWGDIIDDYGYDMTSIYGVAGYVLAKEFYETYYDDVVSDIMHANGWSETTE